MKIGIMSDSHDNYLKIKAAVSLFRDEKVDIVIHGGDLVAPFSVDLLYELKVPVYSVKGNNDGEYFGLKKKYSAREWSYHPTPYDFEVKGYKVALMHEPFALDALLKSKAYNLIVYGHTHKIDVRKEGTSLLVNPGETAGIVTGKSTVVLVDTQKQDAFIKEL